MISADQINEEIAKLEESPVSFENCHRLATLYVLRDHISSEKTVGATRQNKDHEFPNVGAVTDRGKICVNNPSSEFLRTVNGKVSDAVWSVLDELLGTLKIVNPRLYDGVLRRLDE